MFAQVRAANENKKPIQMVRDAIDMYLPFRNISNHDLVFKFMDSVLRRTNYHR